MAHDLSPATFSLFRRGSAYGFYHDLVLGNILERRLPAALDRGLLGGGRHLFDLVHDVHTFDDLAESGVTGTSLSGVEIAIILDIDEELSSGTVWVVGSGHGNGAALIGNAVARLVLDTRLGLFLFFQTRFEAAPLDHEVRDNPVEDRAVVKLIIYVAQEVLDGDRRLVSEQLDLNGAFGSL